METRILVIEDNPANLELMGYLLQAFGYTPIVASSGEEGLDAAHRGAFELILCDIQLPGIDGHEVARQLKRDPALRGVPLVAVTALAMVGDRDRVLASGFDGYVAKPIVPETFVRQIESFLRPDQRVPSRTPSPEEGTTTSAPAPPPRGTLLIVDDSPTNLAVYSRLLESCGYAVFAAETIKDGIESAHQNAPRIIISDVQLTNETGYDLCRKVKADPWLRSIPFIFLTSTALSEKDRAIGLALGADRFLIRPIEPTTLLAAIEAVLSKG